jgi:hypothetical protein|tara:strand:- start:2682 stop:2885 length:204 start_codon:yes stop_codon:yes gene_type:complete
MDDWIMRKLSDKKYAIAAQICNLCGEQALRFRDQKSLDEYEISGCCQHCQDEIFEVDPFSEEDADEV